jgi:hypothetical protein
MSAVVTSYILVAPEGFGINTFYGQTSGVAISIALMIWFLLSKNSYWKMATVAETNRRQDE